jgi:hypothetical protein
VSIGHEAVIVHPDATKAVSMASHPDVSLFAKTKTPNPPGLFIRRASAQALVIIDSNHAESLFLYIAARCDKDTIS